MERESVCVRVCVREREIQRDIKFRERNTGRDNELDGDEGRGKERVNFKRVQERERQRDIKLRERERNTGRFDELDGDEEREKE